MQNNNHRRNNYHRFDNRSESAGDRQGRQERSENHFDHTRNHKKYNRLAILLKSTVFALFIVLVTLSAAFVIIKNKKKDSILPVQECSKSKAIQISHAIEKFEIKDGEIYLLTKIDKSGKQELIKLEGRCNNESARILFQASNVEAK